MIWDGEMTEDEIRANLLYRKATRYKRKYGTRDAQHAMGLILVACGAFGGFMYYICSTALPH